MKKYLLPFLSLFLIVFCSCSSLNSAESAQDNLSFKDRKTVLTNYADNFILPTYQNLSSSLTELNNSFQDFKQNKNLNTLDDLQNKFKASHLVWQEASIYELGPAYDYELRAHLSNYTEEAQNSNYRTDTNRVKLKINQEALDFSKKSSQDWKGFPALDYLLFLDVDKDAQEVLDSYAVLDSESKKTIYTEKVIEDILSRVLQVKENWERNYRTEFIQKDGTAKGSSISDLANQYSKTLEEIKNKKVGGPAGFQSSDYVNYPHFCEGYYSEISKELILRQIDALEKIFIGKNGDLEGLGFKANLDSLRVPRDNGKLLSDEITKQFQSIKIELNKLEKTLPEEIQKNNPQVEKLYKALERSVVLVKNEMVSGLGTSINYQDNDGD